MKTPLIFAITAIIICIVFWFIWPPDREIELRKHVETEAILKHELKRLHFENRKLKSRDSVRSIAYAKVQDSVKILSEKTAKVRIVYRDARAATETRLDSTNLYNEVIAGRELIDAQESHINGLLDLVHKGDELIASKMEIIKNQDIQLVNWEARYNNMVSQKDKEIKRERKRGNKKFIKGVGMGAAIVVLLVLV